MEKYIDMYGLIRPAIKCSCGHIMKYEGYDEEPYPNYIHKCNHCGKVDYVHETYYEALWDILNQVLV